MTKSWEFTIDNNYIIRKCQMSPSTISQSMQNMLIERIIKRDVTSGVQEGSLPAWRLMDIHAVLRAYTLEQDAVYARIQ